MPQNKSLSRRQALKTLAAATGAIALTNLPGKWETPVVEIGAIPAHAQSSGLTISNLTGSIPTINNCQNGNGSSEILTFNYNDPTGRVTTGSMINEFYEYLPSGFSGDDSLPITDPRVTHNGNGYAGTITVTYCAEFEGDTQIRETISLTNAAGMTSNVLSITLDAPVGANAAGTSGAGRTGHR
jgi:hypothetical protein